MVVECRRIEVVCADGSSRTTFLHFDSTLLAALFDERRPAGPRFVR